jgi:short subunit dehydrogenase-like uncharacterized protein
MNSSDTVVVIGGSSGMGLAVARRCLADGASVVIAGRSGERLEAAQAELGCQAGCAPLRPTSAPRMLAGGSITFTSGMTGTVLHVEGGQLLV